MYCIRTKYLGPTDTKGSRIKATDSNGKTITVSKDHSLSTEDSHAEAAVALCKKLNRMGILQEGYLSTGENVYVFIDKSRQIVIK